MKESDKWLHLFMHRLETKHLREEELCMMADFADSLAIIKGLSADPENPLVKMHLHKAGHILRHFSETDTE